MAALFLRVVVGGGEVCAAPNHIYLLKIVSGEERSGVCSRCPRGVLAMQRLSLSSACGSSFGHQSPANPGGDPLLPRSSSRMGEGRGHLQAQRGKGSSLLLAVTCCASLSVTESL